LIKFQKRLIYSGEKIKSSGPSKFALLDSFLSCDGESINNDEMGRTYRTHMEMKKL
jgi:hypothetical protein